MCVFLHTRMAKTYTSKEVVAMLLADGWICVTIMGSHHQFRHPTRPGRVTVKHPDAEIALGTLRSIFRQAGWDWTARKK